MRRLPPNAIHRAERGWVIVTAMALMAIMLVVGLAILKAVDTQAQQSGQERTREAAFYLAEGLLSAESVVLQNNWPSRAPCSPTVKGCGYALLNTTTGHTCTAASAGTNSTQCPDPTELVATNAAQARVFNDVDVLTSASWTVDVRDDVGSVQGANPTYFSGVGANGVDQTNVGCVNASNVASACTYDFNKNKRMWVRVDATVNGKTRSLVALLQLENFRVPFPRNAVTGGAVDFSNAGNKTIVDATGSQIVVRCAPSPMTTTTTPALTTIPSVAVQDDTGFQSNMQVVLDNGSQDAELLTVSPAYLQNVAKLITFSANPSRGHAIGVPIGLAPNTLNLNGNQGPPNTCERWQVGGGNQVSQLQPPFAYKSDPLYPNALTPGQLAAVTQGALTFTNTCPGNTPQEWTGQIVIVAPVGGCSLATSGGAPVNTAANPGYVIVMDQTPGCHNGALNGPALTVPNNTIFYGVIYMVNGQCATASDPPVISISGSAQIRGGVAVDGNGKLFIGQSSGQQPSIVFDPNAFTAFGAAGAAGLVQNTWRELAPGQ